MKELHEWIVATFDAHLLFERLTDQEIQVFLLKMKERTKVMSYELWDYRYTMYSIYYLVS